MSAMAHIVVIALGSNVGNRYENIESSLRYLESNSNAKIKVRDTSFLYESDPMYVLDQDKFLNCAILIETSLEPLELLAFLKKTEEEIGRLKTIRHGPRSIDLDIIFFDDLIFENSKSSDGSGEKELVIPHFRLHEREFVLRPLMDIVPDFIHPFLNQSVQALHDKLMESCPSTLIKVLPFPSLSNSSMTPILWPLARKTYLMATINATPDSFSSTQPSTTESAIEEGLLAIENGADMIDVGGYSTRPGATLVTAEEETNRVIPVIRGLRQSGLTIPISVDTFRPMVLRAAVAAGANCLNDVTALSGDESDINKAGDDSRCQQMKVTARELGIPVIMMHSRGALNANRYKNYDPQGVVEGVKEELGLKVTNALQFGIRRWNLIVDPGFGFSKSTDGNLELLRRLRDIHSPNDSNVHNSLKGFPTLVGLSRKSFLGQLLQRETTPRDREWATGAAVTAVVQQGADIVRVHRVPEMRDILKIADKVWRVWVK